MAETGYKQKAYDYIKKQIVGGALIPGAIINEKELTKQLGISRTPIREAIQRLAEEGLVVVMPSRGTIVSHISMNDIRQIYQARKLIEPYAVGLAVGHVDRDRMLTYRRIFEEQQNSMGQENDWDSEFHLYLAECSGNQFFKKMVKDLMTQSMRIRVLSNEKKAHRFELARAEHLAIIDAVLAGDPETAQKAVLSHLIRSEEGYREIYPNQTYFSL
ncbi:MAG: GntR family transcriptional regulator [Clostridiaceae bacterium]|nr:GntR family transcriptional regulator [Clostridiaceae bacterium]